MSWLDWHRHYIWGGCRALGHSWQPTSASTLDPRYRCRNCGVYR